MPLSRKALCLIYAVVALIAFVGTWGNNLAYLDQGLLQANVRFWLDTLANPASRSITIDIFFLGLAVFIWMLLEARRLGMRGVWWYLILGIGVAISVTVPVFLINRERVLAEREPSSSAGSLSRTDVVGLVSVTAAFLVYTGAALLV